MAFSLIVKFSLLLQRELTEMFELLRYKQQQVFSFKEERERAQRGCSGNRFGGGKLL